MIKFILKTLIVLMLMTATIVMNALVSNLHTNLYTRQIDQCKTALIEKNEFRNMEQVFDCADNDTTVKVLGTLLFREGTVLE